MNETCSNPHCRDAAEPGRRTCTPYCAGVVKGLRAKARAAATNRRRQSAGAAPAGPDPAPDELLRPEGLVLARFPLHDLERLLGWPMARDLAESLGVTVVAVKGWQVRGVSWKQADELAVAFQWHPLEVFGVDFLEPWVPAGHPRSLAPKRVRPTIHGAIGSAAEIGDRVAARKERVGA